MKNNNLIKNVCLSGCLFLGIQPVIASEELEITCPTITEMLSYKLFGTFADKFNQESGQVVFSGVLMQQNTDKGYWMVDVDGMEAEKLADLPSIIFSTIEKMEPVSLNPYLYTQSPFSVNKKPVCFYTVPNNKAIEISASFYTHETPYIYSKEMIYRKKATSTHY